MVPPAPREAESGEETIVIRQRIGSDVRDLYAETHRQLDRLLLPRVMQHTRGNLQQAALLLGIARVKWTAYDQRGEPVYTFTPIAIVPRGPA